MDEIEMLLEEQDAVALRARIHLLHDEGSSETRRLAARVCATLEHAQLADGSWGRTIYGTLSNLHLLIDLERLDTWAFRRGFGWVLSLKGPMGFHEYWEEGMTIHARDVNCPYGCRLGTPELSGRVSYLFGRIGHEGPVVDETIQRTLQFQRYDGGFHGPRFWGEDRKSCHGATLWVTRGFLSLGREEDTVEDAISFVEQEDVEDTPYQYAMSALALETLYLLSPEETPLAARHIEYLLSLREGGTWRFGSHNATRRQIRANVLTVLTALQKFRPRILSTLG